MVIVGGSETFLAQRLNLLVGPIDTRTK